MSRLAKYVTMLYLNKRDDWDRLCEIKILKTSLLQRNI